MRPLLEYNYTGYTPQILGTIETAVSAAKRAVKDELNSVSDNPVFHFETDNTRHDGRFHGEPVAIGKVIFNLRKGHILIYFSEKISLYVEQQNYLKARFSDVALSNVDKVWRSLPTRASNAKRREQ